MLKGQLIHPELLRALGAAGHGAKVLLADGNYPLSTRSGPRAARIYLNLAPDMVRVTDVLRVLVTAIPIEAAQVMVPDEGPEPEIFAEFRRLLGAGGGSPGPAAAAPAGGLELEPLGRFPFYEAASAEDVAVAVATGDQRLYANLLLTIGVVPP
ncbi:MAG TPA: RbsD/FucU family protein [Chloroflexota bacterium]|nr:RbsD/FucU family protein [Chloroflexota bacterium]